MADKIIAATLKVDTGNSNTEIKEVNKNLGDTKKALSTTSEAAKTASKDIGGTGGSFGNLKEKLSAMPGALGEAGKGVGSLNTAFKALLANPVGLVILAIVGVLTLLYKAFTNTFEGGQKVEQVFAGIKAVVQVVTDRILDLGGAIIKFFSGDFKGAINDAKKAVSGVGDEIAKTYTAVANLTKTAQALKKEQLQNDLEGAERAKKLAILREQAEDPDVSRAQRKAALIELQKEAQQNAKDDIDLAKRTAENKIALLSLGKDGAKKNAEEINQIRIDQINGETQNANELRRISKQVTSVDKQEQAERKEAYKAFLEERNKALAEAKAKQKAINDAGNKAIEDAERTLASKGSREDQLAGLRKEYDVKLAAARLAGVNELKLIEAFQLERDALQDKFDKEDEDKRTERETKKNDFLTMMAKSRLSQIAADNEQIRTDQERQAELDKRTAENKVKSLGAVGDATNALSEIVGKQTIVGKALGIATALINTYQGASEVIRAKSTLPSPFDIIAKVAGVATIIATGLKTVKAITSVQVPGGSGGGGSASAPSISVPAPVAPTAGTTSLDQNSLNSLGNAASRAYVLDTDVQNNREKNTRLSRAARLGG